MAGLVVPETPDAETLTAALRASAPMNATCAFEVVGLSPLRLRLPDGPAVRNHVGGPHAGAIFTLGETSAAALMVVSLGEALADGALALAVGASIEWSKVARSAVIATPVMRDRPEDLLVVWRDGGRPEWATDIAFTRESDGQPCASMTVRLTLVRPRD